VTRSGTPGARRRCDGAGNRERSAGRARRLTFGDRFDAAGAEEAFRFCRPRVEKAKSQISGGPGDIDAGDIDADELAERTRGLSDRWSDPQYSRLQPVTRFR